jgi:hypothetical protein
MTVAAICGLVVLYLLVGALTCRFIAIIDGPAPDGEAMFYVVVFWPLAWVLLAVGGVLTALWWLAGGTDSR